MNSTAKGRSPMKCLSHSVLVFIGFAVTCAAGILGCSVLPTQWLHKCELRSVLPRLACSQGEVRTVGSEWQHVGETVGRPGRSGAIGPVPGPLVCRPARVLVP